MFPRVNDYGKRSDRDEIGNPRVACLPAFILQTHEGTLPDEITLMNLISDNDVLISDSTIGKR